MRTLRVFGQVVGSVAVLAVGGVAFFIGWGILVFALMTPFIPAFYFQSIGWPFGAAALYTVIIDVTVILAAGYAWANWVPEPFRAVSYRTFARLRNWRK